jgi:bifunctional non-homologous end joining protein LigD
MARLPTTPRNARTRGKPAAPPGAAPGRSAGRSHSKRPPPRTGLAEYRRKRDFGITPEPAGDHLPTSKLPRFVVQMHDATRLHWDFRLEAEGVLKSWAVPKGPSLDPADKRLAVRTEDHPMDYIDFEGVIPAGEYGGGPVIVWDRGTFLNIKTDRSGKPIPMADALRKGSVDVWLEGEKLRGGYSLVRTRPGPGKKEHWLLIKKDDEHADRARDITTESPRSVKTGRTIQEVLKSSGDSAQIASKTARASRPGSAPMPKWIEPMLATLAAGPPAKGDWIYEPKLDGFRALAFRDGENIRLLSRNKKDLGVRFPEIVEALSRQPVERFIVDGEVVALDQRGLSSFSALQQRLTPISPIADRRSRPQLLYCIFDLLYANGFDTRELPQHERTRLLEQAVNFSDPVRRSEPLEGEGGKLLARACRAGWEGLIAKRADSSYTSGRSRDWLKLKCTVSQEFVIGGWTDPRGSREAFGSLLVGYYQGRGKARRLIYAGRVGTGYSDRALRELMGMLRPLATQKSPFEPDPEIPRRGVHFLEPRLVAQVGFTEWTHDHHIRHPRFLGLRPDKNPSSVVREQRAR